MRIAQKLRGAALLLALMICLSACGRLVPEDDAEDGLVIYASFYPVYALTELIVKDVPGVELHCLVQPQDGCLRNYALSDWDLYLLGSAADMVVIGGRGLEAFESSLYALGEQGPAVLTAFAELTLYNEAAGEGSEDSSHWETANPHAYMSPALAKDALEAIAEALSLYDPARASLYAENLQAGRKRLDDLETAMREAAADFRGRKVLVFNEALVYTAQALELEIDGWFSRESGQALSESEFARFQEAVAGSEARVVLVEKQAPASLIDQLESAGYCVARVDILSEIREASSADGYFAAQNASAEAVAEAFGKINEAN